MEGYAIGCDRYWGGCHDKEPEGSAAAVMHLLCVCTHRKREHRVGEALAEAEVI